MLAIDEVYSWAIFTIFLAIFLAMGFGAVQFLSYQTQHDQHEDYKTVVSKNYSDLHVGQTVNLKNYDVAIQSGDNRVLQVVNAGNAFYNSDLVIAIAKGDTDLIISDKGSSASKVIKVHVE